MNKVHCKRLDIKDCPYRENDPVIFKHFYHTCGMPPEDAAQRALKVCNSIPCNYAIELLLLRILNNQWDGDVR